MDQVLARQGSLLRRNGASAPIQRISGLPLSLAVPPAQLPNNFPMYGVTPGSLHPQECGGRCAARCSATACQKCCAAGTYGNKETCPCYNNWKTKRGGPKCP